MDEFVRRTLRALSIGDAFGFKLAIRPDHVERRALPDAPWRWSDDTAMAASVARILTQHGALDQDALFLDFVERYRADPRRGYGSGMKRLLGRSDGHDWRETAPALFGGSGSYGNGAAMRVAPIGVLFRDVDEIIAQARASARVTHTHAEGVAGAIAIAVATAHCAVHGPAAAADLLEVCHTHTPDSRVRELVRESMSIPPGDVSRAVDVLGNGSLITAQDTVPLCLWWTSHHLDDFAEAMWGLVELGGDEDTNCAIVAGMLGAAGLEAPPEWDERVEPLPIVDQA